MRNENPRIHFGWACWGPGAWGLGPGATVQSWVTPQFRIWDLRLADPIFLRAVLSPAALLAVPWLLCSVCCEMDVITLSPICQYAVIPLTTIYIANFHLSPHRCICFLLIEDNKGGTKRQCLRLVFANCHATVKSPAPWYVLTPPA